MKIKSIQGIRAFAIIFVILSHLDLIYNFNLTKLGARAVEFFFLISGYLIAVKYLNTEKFNNYKSSIKYSFLKAKKIYPLVFVTSLLMGVMLFKNVFNSATSLSQATLILISNLLLIQSWIPINTFYFGLNGVTWFISTLLFCYITITFFFKLIKKYNLKLLIVLIFTIKIIYQLIFGILPVDVDYFTYIFPLYRSLDFGLGIIIGAITLNADNKNNNDYLLIITLVLYALMIIFLNDFIISSIFHIVEFLIIYLIVSNNGKINKIIFENSIVVFIGDSSETLFLTHHVVITYFAYFWGKIIKQSVFIEYLLTMVLIFVIGYLIKVTTAFYHRKSNS